MLVFDEDAALASIRAKADQLEDQIAQRLLHHAQDEAPVDTGALVLSGHVTEGQAGEAIVAFPRDYAHWVEFGTKIHPKPNPFLRRSIMMTADEVLTITR